MSVVVADGFLGIDHVPFNVRLRNARLRMGWTRRRLAAETGLDAGSVGSYEALKTWPTAGVQERIATALQDAAEYLFPPEVGLALRGRSARTTTSVLPVEALTLDAPEVRMLAAPNDVASEVVEAAKSNAVEHALDTLSRKDRTVIRRRFGFDGEPETFEAIAQDMHVTKERVRQIQERALRRLRNPAVSRELRDFVMDYSA